MVWIQDCLYLLLLEKTQFAEVFFVVADELSDELSDELVDELVEGLEVSQKFVDLLVMMAEWPGVALMGLGLVVVLAER
jgi:hypothetical protein